MTREQSRRSTYELMSAMARSGDYIDCWAIEAKLRMIGFSADKACKAMSNADERTALHALCTESRTRARQVQRMKEEALARSIV